MTGQIQRLCRQRARRQAQRRHGSSARGPIGAAAACGDKRARRLSPAAADRPRGGSARRPRGCSAPWSSTWRAPGISSPPCRPLPHSSTGSRSSAAAHAYRRPVAMSGRLGRTLAEHHAAEGGVGRVLRREDGSDMTTDSQRTILTPQVGAVTTTWPPGQVIWDR